MKKSHVPSFSHFNMRNLSQPFAKRIAWSQNLSILPQETPRFRTVGIRIKQLCRRQASKLLPQKWPSENQETSKRGFTASREILFLEWVLPNFLKQIRFILSKRLWKFRNSRSEFCVSVGKRNEVYFSWISDIQPFRGIFAGSAKMVEKSFQILHPVSVQTRSHRWPEPIALPRQLQTWFSSFLQHPNWPRRCLRNTETPGVHGLFGSVAIGCIITPKLIFGISKIWHTEKIRQYQCQTIMFTADKWFGYILETHPKIQLDFWIPGQITISSLYYSNHFDPVAPNHFPRTSLAISGCTSDSPFEELETLRYFTSSLLLFSTS